MYLPSATFYLPVLNERSFRGNKAQRKDDASKAGRAKSRMVAVARVRSCVHQSHH